MTNSLSSRGKKTIEDLYLEWAHNETLQMLRFPEMVLSVSEDLRAIYSEDALTGWNYARRSKRSWPKEKRNGRTSVGRTVCPYYWSVCCYSAPLLLGSFGKSLIGKYRPIA